MMKTRVGVCVLWLACSLVNAQNPAESAHGNETVLIALENGWNQAQLHHDSKALELFLADTFVSTDNDGTLMTKAQFLADNDDLSYAASLMTNSGVQVFLYGDLAVVVGIYHAKGLNKGKPFEHYGRFTDTWAYLNGKWLCVATHTSALKKRP
jgi:ketosteroid isomerase-like protein